MDAIDLLTEQHRTLETSFEAALQAEGEQRLKLFREAADLLMSHVLVEERIFYPAVKAKRTEDILLESLEEHLSLKRLLADLDQLATEDPHYEPKLHVLGEQAEHHHQEEEKHLFPKVKQLLAAEEREALGSAMQAEQQRLLQGSPRDQAASETKVAASL